MARHTTARKLRSGSRWVSPAAAAVVAVLAGAGAFVAVDDRARPCPHASATRRADQTTMPVASVPTTTSTAAEALGPAGPGFIAGPGDHGDSVMLDYQDPLKHRSPVYR